MDVHCNVTVSGRDVPRKTTATSVNLGDGKLTVQLDSHLKPSFWLEIVVAPVGHIFEVYPIVGEFPLRLDFTPDAIREHFDDEPGVLAGLTDEDLLQVGVTALNDDVLYEAFHAVLKAAVHEQLSS